MKQLAQYQDGRLELQEVPQPVPPPGGILVRTTHSVVSVGTERMKVEQARMNLMQKALARPDQVRKVFDTARTLGWRSAIEKVRNRLQSPTPLGYSAAGVVVEVDSGNTRFRVGDRVACGGAECAFHAEYIAIPDMLAAPIPPEVENWEAAYTTLCSIAMQSVRQADPQIGDRAMVMGQGLVGLLITALLKASGVRVLAVDVIESRRAIAEAMGAERVVIAGEQKLIDEARAWTDGFGVDHAFICTATRNNTPVEQAAEVLRDRGRLIVVNITGIAATHRLFYEKELEIRYSRAYGPGRYDPAYEWAGTDYPIGYVRWTEQRNFQACLHLMASGQLNLAAITTKRVPFADCLGVYQQLVSDPADQIGVVLEYPSGEQAEVRTPTKHAEAWTTNTQTKAGHPMNRVDVIGAGNFARTMLLPYLQGKIELGTVVNRTSLSANHVKTKFGFQEAATDHNDILRSKEPAAVIIATRHHLHAQLVKDALAVNRHVFVEKPLCITREELEAIDNAVSQSRGSVMVGFNRRFAPASVHLSRWLKDLPGPKSATYRVMNGPLDPQHWYANVAESGGRVIGEVCHFLDYFCFLFGSKPVRVIAQPLWPPIGQPPMPDSIAAQVEFADHSCGQVIFSAEGDPAYPKETLTVFAAGSTAELTNFQRLVLHRNRGHKSRRYSSKGHAEEMDAWLSFLRGGGEHPLPYEQARLSMLLTFAVLESIQRGSAVEVG